MGRVQAGRNEVTFLDYWKIAHALCVRILPSYLCISLRTSSEPLIFLVEHLIANLEGFVLLDYLSQLFSELIPNFVEEKVCLLILSPDLVVVTLQ